MGSQVRHIGIQHIGVQMPAPPVSRCAVSGTWLKSSEPQTLAIPTSPPMQYDSRFPPHAVRFQIPRVRTGAASGPAPECGYYHNPSQSHLLLSPGSSSCTVSRVITQPPGGLGKGQQTSQGTLHSAKSPQKSRTHLEQAPRPQALYPSVAPSSAWQMNHDGKKETCNSSRLLRYLPFLDEQPHHSPHKKASLSFIPHARALPQAWHCVGHHGRYQMASPWF